MIDLTPDERAFLLHLLQSQQVQILSPNAGAIVAVAASIATKLNQPPQPSSQERTNGSGQ